MKLTLNKNFTVEAFDALTLLNIYHWADLAYEGVETKTERNKLLKTLHRNGLLLDVEDPEEGANQIAERYNQAIEAHVQNTLPEGYEPTHDYWGAKCIAYKPGWDAPKHNTFFAGDSSGQYMAFESAEALHDYTQDCLKEIKNNKN